MRLASGVKRLALRARAVVSAVAESPLVSGGGMSLVAAMPVVIVLLGAAWREANGLYTAAALIVVAMHAAAGVAGGALFRVRRSLPVALLVAALISLAGTRLLLSDMDPGGSEAGSERLLMSVSLLAVLAVALALVARLARRRPGVRRLRDSSIAVDGAIGLAMLVVALGVPGPGAPRGTPDDDG